MHLTGTCDSNPPRFITLVEIKSVCKQDTLATEDIHHVLAEELFSLEQHTVDTPYVSDAHRVKTKDNQGVDLLGLVRLSLKSCKCCSAISFRASTKTGIRRTVRPQARHDAILTR